MIYDNKFVQKYVKEKKNELKENIENLKKVYHTTPCLAIVQVGENPSSNSYVKGKLKDCEEVGIKTHLIKIEETEDKKAISNHLEMIVDELNKDDNVHGIIVQLPLPEGVSFNFDSINPKKDVDGFNKDTLFVPCTPLGVIKFLQNTNYEFAHKDILVLGRSKTVGKPLAKILTDLDATVTLAHSRSIFLNHNIHYDLIISCTNQIDLFHFCDINEIDNITNIKLIKRLSRYSYGTYLFTFDGYIDIGLEKDENNKLVGNFNKESHNRALKELQALQQEKLEEDFFEEGINIYAISGIGGVGLLTRLTLMQNVLGAYESHYN